MKDSLARVERNVVACDKCPRLRAWCEQVAREKRRAYLAWDYWGKPVPGFGDPEARLLVLGLAPGAHGSNRTGRMFTGDSSGDFLYRALHAAGFASQPESLHRGDGLTLKDCWITAAARCAPPDNKPERGEVLACRPYLEREFALLKRVRVVVALGHLAFNTYLELTEQRKSAFEFAHGREYKLRHTLIASYHPSRQNTQTGRLTAAMLQDVFDRAQRLLSAR